MIALNRTTAYRQCEGWGLRIAHSVVQATINLIVLRFAIFMAVSFVLLVMSVRAAVIVF